jgi:hypothetical protein
MPFFYVTFFARCEISEYFSKMLAQLGKQRLLPILGDENDVV